MVAVHYVHKAIRHLVKHDDAGEGSNYTDAAMKVLDKSKTKNAVKKAIEHIETHDNLYGGSDDSDAAVKSLYKSLEDNHG